MNTTMNRKLQSTTAPTILNLATQVERKVISAEQFALAVGIGINRARTMVKQKRIRHVLYGRRICIPISEIDDFLEREMTEVQK